jgi:hypothetical protein
MTLIFFFIPTSLRIKRCEVFICQFYVYFCEWKKRKQFYIPYRIHTGRAICILSSTVVSDGILHTLTQPRWGSAQLMVIYPVSRCKGLKKSINPQIPGQIFFQCRFPSKNRPLFLSTSQLSLRWKRDLKKARIFLIQSGVHKNEYS